MKFLVRKDKDTKKFVDMQSVNEEYIHEYQEVDPLPQKDGYSVLYEYDNDSQKVVGKYVEIQKSETQQLKEDLEQTKIALAEMTALLSTVVTPPNVG